MHTASLANTNENAKPFTWTKDPNKIIAAVKRGHQVLDSIHQGIGSMLRNTANELCLNGVGAREVDIRRDFSVFLILGLQVPNGISDDLDEG